MNAARRVPARYLVLLRDWLNSQAVDTAAILRMAGIDAAKFDRRDATLDPPEMEAFIANARRLTGRSDLGFELGRLIKMTSHDLLGYGMLSCRNIDEVMRMVARHYHLMTETFTMRYHRDPGGRGETVYTPTIAMPLETLRFYLETIAVAHDNQVRLMLGNAGGSYDVYVTMPAPAHVARYHALAPTRFHFEDRSPPGVRVVMGPAVLEHLLPFADVHLARDIDRRCGSLGQRPPATSREWVDYIRMTIRQAEGEAPTLESIASQNRVSSRTIDRHLRRENFSFREIVNQVRFERACELLQDSGATVAQIALRLGFSDSANFSRAFRRAVGVPPSAYRQKTTRKRNASSQDPFPPRG